MSEAPRSHEERDESEPPSRKSRVGKSMIRVAGLGFPELEELANQDSCLHDSLLSIRYFPLVGGSSPFLDGGGPLEKTILATGCRPPLSINRQLQTFTLVSNRGGGDETKITGARQEGAIAVETPTQGLDQTNLGCLI